MNVRCVKCKATDGVASVDTYTGTCLGTVVVNKDGELDFDPHGYTEIHWDSCEQIGWSCRSCYAEELVVGEDDTLDDALKRLVEVAP